MIQSMTPNLIVNDVNKTVDYYRDLFGFKLEMSVPESGTLDWAMMKHGTVEIMFQTLPSIAKDVPAFAGKQPGGAFTLFVIVADVKKLYTTVKSKVELAVDFNTTFYGMDEFTIKDLNGYYVTFATPAKQQ